MRSIARIAHCLCLLGCLPARCAQTTAIANARACRTSSAGRTCGPRRGSGPSSRSRTRSSIDPEFEIPYYGLGRAHMALKNFNCRDHRATNAAASLYRAQAGRQFTNAQEAQRYRQDRITEIDEQIRQAAIGADDRRTRRIMLRQLQNVRRDIQENIQRGNNMTIESSVPAWVSLALGSAYFRSGRSRDAEREYKATIAADSRAGRSAQQSRRRVSSRPDGSPKRLTSLQAAKKTGFKVNPELEKVIRDKAK